MMSGGSKYAESGVPGFDFNTWMSIFAPLNTPKEVIAPLNSEILKALALPDVKERLVSIGLEIDDSPPEKLATVTKARSSRCRRSSRTRAQLSNDFA